jgi:hypothetical protein
MSQVDASMKGGVRVRPEMSQGHFPNSDSINQAEDTKRTVAQLVVDALNSRRDMSCQFCTPPEANDPSTGDTGLITIPVEPRPTTQFDDAARALSAFDGTGAKAFANNGQLGVRELKNAGIEDKDFSKFLRFGVGSGGGQMSMLDLAEAEKAGLIEISADGKISMTKSGKEAAAEWKKNPEKPEVTPQRKALEESSQAAGRAIAHHDSELPFNRGGDGSLDLVELQKAGITDPQELMFLAQVGGRFGGPTNGLSAADLTAMEHLGLVKISKDGDLSMTERGKQVAEQWSSPVRSQPWCGTGDKGSLEEVQPSTPGEAGGRTWCGTGDASGEMPTREEFILDRLYDAMSKQSSRLPDSVGITTSGGTPETREFMLNRLADVFGADAGKRNA